VGVILLYFGYNASESPTGEITEALTGRFDDETMFYFIGGAVAVVIGGVMLFRK
jgi:hypothetical protein